MRIIGPNCLGIIIPGKNLNLSFAGAMPKAGNVAFISQSGALCTSVLDVAIEGKIGFSHFVSIGNTIDVGFGDLIDYFGADEGTKSIILYIESITRARRFMTAARAFARTKPIIAFKSGRFPESAQVAASHTGALAAEDAIYDAAFQRIGLARVYDTNAGGPGVIATDSLIEHKGTLAILSEQTMEQLNLSLPSSWSHRNPVDVLGDANAKRIEKAAQLVLNDPGVDALLVILTPQAMTNVMAIAKVVGKLAQTTQKPVLAAWLGGSAMREGIRHLADQGVAAYQTPEQAIRSFMTLVGWTRSMRRRKIFRSSLRSTAKSCARSLWPNISDTAIC
jgi:acetyltransferase